MAEARRGKNGSRGSRATSGGTSGKRRRKPRSRIARVMRRIGLTALIAFLAVTVLGTAAVVIGYNTTDIPDPNADFQTNTTFVQYRDGSPMGSFAVQNRQSIPYDQMPQTMKDAVVAAENRSFWTDPGISVLGMIRAAWAIATGGEMQGGSTITQQYIKIMYLDSERTMTRKIRELFLAVKMNREVPKQDILEGYLNTIYFGRGAYGIQAASKSFFNVDAKDLTVPQAAVLASVLNNPGMYDPSGGEEARARLLERYRYVLDGMVEMGSITQAQRNEYAKQLPEFPEIPINERYGGPNGFLLNMVQSELAAKGFDESQVQGGGLTIVTTIDKPSQDAAVKTAQKYEKEAAEAADKPVSGIHASIASVDVATGEIRALYGGADYIKNSRNWATTPRMAASTFKTFNLAAGLEDGFTLRSMLRGNTFTPPGDGVPVRNEFGHQYGQVSLLKATADSINTAFVDLTVQMTNGPEQVIKAANDAGVPTGPGWDKNNRIGLGTAEASPLAMASAYATYADNGRHHTPHIVREVRDANGKVLYTADTEGEQKVDEDISRDVTHALTSVVQSGTGARVAALGRPIAGKTGTAGVEDEIRTAWFVAYTKQVSTSVLFIAGDDGNGDLHQYRRPGDGTFFGGTYPAMAWLDFMETATKGMPIEEFDGPAWVNRERPKGRQQETTRPRTREPEPTTRSAEPTETTEPTESPTNAPSESPTEQPTSQQPTEKPTQQPTEKPTEQPTQQPTQQPTTQQPTQKPTQQPTQKPTQQPSQPPKATQQGQRQGASEPAG
ncbi:transglycosylase domain-containing protein [Enemella sp. A6]|uniref:transglycosylase domain-containing protein n=1 Tax=Enemella sp. A6 TaxID=3440152 RepID=UPI003EBFB4DE